MEWTWLQNEELRIDKQEALNATDVADFLPNSRTSPDVKRPSGFLSRLDSELKVSEKPDA
jgi:hypothetical protein